MKVWERAKAFLKELAMLLPNLVLLLGELMRDKRIPKRVKLVLAGTAAYLATPMDVIPDFIPVIGYLDDLVLVSVVMDGLLNHVDRAVIKEHWRGSPDSLEFLGRVASRIAFFVPRRIKIKIFNPEVKIW